MASKSSSTKTVEKKRGQIKSNKKNLTWTDQDSSFFAEVLFDPQYGGSDSGGGGGGGDTLGWATSRSNRRKKQLSDLSNLPILP